MSGDYAEFMCVGCDFATDTEAEADDHKVNGLPADVTHAVYPYAVLRYNPSLWEQ